MAGELEFTLGLEVSGFLHSMGLGHGSILGLERAAHGLHAVMEKTFGAIEQAGELEHLARRTGESVGNLFRLEEGFKAAGVSADTVGGSLFMMQKALGGVNEEGEDTSNIFSKLGLSINDLKRKGGAGAFQDIIGALSKLDQSSASKAASGIFGRMGAANAVQISRSGKDFAEAMAAAGEQGVVFERMAGSADRLHQNMLAVKRQVTGLFAGMGEGAVVAVEMLSEKLASINLTQLGLRIGDEITAAFEAVRLDQFGEYFRLTLQKVTFDVANFFGKMLQDALSNKQDPNAPGGNGSFGDKTMELVRGGLTAAAGSVLLAGGAIGVPGMQKAGDFMAEKSMEHFGESFGWVAKAADSAADIGKAGVQGGMGGVNPYAAPREAMKAGLLGSATGRRVAADHKGEQETDLEDMLFGKGLKHKTEGNAFEKMGFATNGGGGPQQETARNTGKMVDLLTDLRNAGFRRPDNEPLVDPSFMAINLPL